MFRRYWSALPKDPIFPSTFEGLGYFVNDDDEVRSIENPDSYFRFRVNRNDRVNSRRRFHFDLAIEDTVHKRLEEDTGLEKHTLPVGRPTNKPHIPIFASKDLASKGSIVLFVGDTQSSLGVISARVANGPGGLNKGSAVSLVHAVGKHLPGAGLVLANPGALYWWPESGRAIRARDAEAAPRTSMVSLGRRDDKAVNCVPGHETEAGHLARVFELIEERTSGDVVISIFGVEKGAELVEKFLDDMETWKRWGPRLQSMVLIGTQQESEFLINEDLKTFMAKRCRAYTTSDQPLDTPLAAPSGNLKKCIPPLGLPVYSSSEPKVSEIMAVTVQDAAVRYLAEAAAHADFENPEVVLVDDDDDEEAAQGLEWQEMRKAWEELDDEQKPVVSWVDEDMLREERMWNMWEETGVAEAEEAADGRSEKLKQTPEAAPAV